MNILGIDPGYERMGYAVCTEKKLAGMKLIEAGLLKSSSRQLFSLRLAELKEGLDEILRKFSITEAAIEKMFFTAKWKPAIKVAEARGMVLTTLAAANIPIFEYAPTEVKRAITGNGTSAKKAVTTMVMKLCHLSTPITEDNAADAGAIALTHLLYCKMPVPLHMKQLQRERAT